MSSTLSKLISRWKYNSSVSCNNCLVRYCNVLYVIMRYCATPHLQHCLAVVMQVCWFVLHGYTVIRWVQSLVMKWLLYQLFIWWDFIVYFMWSNIYIIHIHTYTYISTYAYMITIYMCYKIVCDLIFNCLFTICSSNHVNFFYSLILV